MHAYSVLGLVLLSAALIWTRVNWDSISVAVGQAIGIGEQVGVLGQTGNASRQDRAEAHVHFEIRHNGQKIDPFQFMAQPCPWGAPP
jgi:hypothetical protein